MTPIVVSDVCWGVLALVGLINATLIAATINRLLFADRSQILPGILDREADDEREDRP